MNRSKRKFVTSVSNYTRSKKQKLWDRPLPKPGKRLLKWISATKTRNYMLKDTLVDWLKEHKQVSSPHRGNKQDGFISFIMNRGIEFEDKLIKYIHSNKLPIVSVSEHITDSSVQKTIDLMHAGTPIIHSAPVRNSKNKTNGIIDLLVRSDFLHKLVNICPLTLEEQVIPAPKLGTNYHYLVIDIKFSTLPLRADGRHILNSNSYPAYKAQCRIYTEAVGSIQGYTARYSYILGRRWNYTQQGVKFSSLECLDKLGVIDYKTIDKSYVQSTRDAITWVRQNIIFGHQWSVQPPSRLELYPNMCHDSGKWQKHKGEIAKQIGEITNIWHCGIKHRNKCIDNDIMSWTDPKCTARTLGMKGSRGNIINDILNVNRQYKDNIRPRRILSNVHDWKQPCNEMFVDFETLSDIFSPFSNLPKQDKSDMIFMIGVWWKNGDNWVYKRFTCNSQTYTEEYRIMDEFHTFVEEKRNPKLWFWCAERRFWMTAKKRQLDIAHSQSNERRCDHISNDWDIQNWADMSNLFRQEPIVIRNCFNFGLKSVAKAMQNHGLIDTKIESNCDSGMQAMIKAYNCYQEEENPASCSVMNDIAKYNQFDVSVLKEILFYLRENHIHK